MSESPAVYEAETRPLSVDEVKAQINLIQEVLKHIMQSGQHYGKIPGAGDKPTLLKPGAEKIATVFRLAADPHVEDLSYGDILRYRVLCKMISKATGIVEGVGVGECSSEEEKYKWRAVVSTDEWNATPDTHRRIKYTKYRDNPTVKQIRTNPYDLANTILKMAKKRAMVDAVLTCTAASDIFTQDVEEMPEEYLNQGRPGNGQNQPPAAPQQRTAATAQPQGTKATVITTIDDVTRKTGKTKDGKDYTRYAIKTPEGEFSTFSETMAAAALTASTVRKRFKITYTESKFGKDAMSGEPVEEQNGEEGNAAS